MEEITIAYRKLAIKLCPNRYAGHLRDFVPLSEYNINTHMSPLSLDCQWKYINMAYDVLGIKTYIENRLVKVLMFLFCSCRLGNALHRSIYDRLGEAGLLQGAILPNGYFPPYQYHGNHMKVYNDVFGSYSPYANVIDTIVSESPPLYNNKGHGIGVRKKDEPVVKVICLDLNEVYNGCIKLMHVMRQEFVDADEKRTEQKRKTLTLNVPPGVTAGTSFCFKEEGDRGPTKIPSDIIFMVQDKPHQYFKRINQHDLVYRHDISLCQALTGFKFTIESLDNRKLTISVSDVVTPGYTKIIPGEGLPKCKDLDLADTFKNKGGISNDYGDLVIEFSSMLDESISNIFGIKT